MSYIIRRYFWYKNLALLVGHHLSMFFLDIKVSTLNLVPGYVFKKNKEKESFKRPGEISQINMFNLNS